MIIDQWSWERMERRKREEYRRIRRSNGSESQMDQVMSIRIDREKRWWHKWIGLNSIKEVVGEIEIRKERKKEGFPEELPSANQKPFSLSIKPNLHLAKTRTDSIRVQIQIQNRILPLPLPKPRPAAAYYHRPPKVWEKVFLVPQNERVLGAQWLVGAWAVGNRWLKRYLEDPGPEVFDTFETWGEEGWLEKSGDTSSWLDWDDEIREGLT